MELHNIRRYEVDNRENKGERDRDRQENRQEDRQSEYVFKGALPVKVLAQISTESKLN